MAGKLQNFLSELAVSPEKLSRYQQTPDAAMKEAGLDADECAALKSGDPARVYASLAGQSASAAQPQAGCIYAAQPQAGCIYAAQPQAGCIYAAQPQAGCIYAAQPQAGCIYAAQPQAGCIYAAQPQAGCIYAAQPQAGCIYAAQPPAAALWAAQPCTIVVHHIIHAAQPQPIIQSPAPAEPNQPSSQPAGGKTTPGKTS